MNRLSLLCFAALGLLLGSAARAKEPPPTCEAATPFVAPPVSWMGKFIYKARFKVRAGRAEWVDVTTYQGADRDTNRTLTQALETYIGEHYRCKGTDQIVEEYLVVNLNHDVPALAELQQEGRARKEAWQKARDAAKAASAPYAEPFPTDVLCTHMERPSMPQRISGAGQLMFHAVVEVRNGAIGVVDIKVMQGSPDPQVNRMFINSLTDTIRAYRCGGTHVFEQEFQFRLS